MKILFLWLLLFRLVYILKTALLIVELETQILLGKMEMALAARTPAHSVGTVADVG